MGKSFQVECMRSARLIKGGSLDNAIVCSTSEGWLNPPLRFPNEPCRRKVLDLVGALSLFAQNGSQGIPTAHLVAFKAWGHALHDECMHSLPGHKHAIQGAMHCMLNISTSGLCISWRPKFQPRKILDTFSLSF